MSWTDDSNERNPATVLGGQSLVNYPDDPFRLRQPDIAALTAFRMATASVGSVFATACRILTMQAMKEGPLATVGVADPPPVQSIEPSRPLATVQRAPFIATTTVTAEMVESCVAGPSDSPRPAPSPAPSVKMPRSRYGMRRRPRRTGGGYGGS